MAPLRYKRRRCDCWSPFYFLFILSMVVRCGSSDNQKCLNIPDVHPKKYVHYENQSLNITLEMSSRITHQLSTHIFKIFLQEVLGYPKVEIYRQEDHFEVIEVIERLSGPSTEQQTIPRSMINLEVWVPPELDVMPLIDTHYVNEGGNIAPPGRFGWFIPMNLTNPIRTSKRWTTAIHDIHWTFFRDQSFSEIFDITDREDLDFIKKSSYIDTETKRFHCMDPVCEQGMYVPKQCSGRQPCAYLLTSYYNDTKFVISDIDDLQLYVKVIWVGPNLKQVAAKLKDKYLKRGINKSIMILSWTPSDVILDAEDYMSVLFTRCEFLSSYKKAGCKYELTRLTKFSWSKLNNLAQPAYDALHKFKFEKEQYEYLLKLYDDYSHNMTIYDIACKWMRTNDSWWKPWKQIEKNPVIYIGGIFPITGSSYNGKSIVRSAVMARSAINANKTILPDYELKLLVTNGQCQADKVMKAFIDYIVEKYYHKLVGVLGPACSDTVEPLAGVSKLYGTMVISYSAEGSSFSDREKYPYFFRTIGENKQYKHVYLKFFKEFGWKRIAALTEDGQKYTEYISHMQKFLEENDITLISNTKFPRERDISVMTGYLEDLKRKRARIIIADVYDEVARTVMCEAYKLKMTAREGYVWFLPKWLNNTFYDTDYYNQAQNENINCTTSEMIKAITGYFAMTHAFFAPDDAIMQENRTVGEWKRDYERSTIASGGISNYGGFAYDAVWTYALALDKLIKTDPEAVFDIHSVNTTNKLVQLIKETDFHGVSGHIKFRGGPSRISIINVMQWYDNESHVVGQFYPDLKDDSPDIIGGNLTFTNNTRIRWFTENNRVPDDGSMDLSKCKVLSGFAEFLNVECQMAIVVLNLIIGFFLIVLLLVVVLWIKKRYEKKMQLTQKYMKSLGLDMTCNLNDLDKWEIPRESVVINRKLGEGAFGTVYGGEAKFPDQGWLAVAVKTLKVGSTTEEKLDFLSEAEVMKRFDHKNIVKLLGVCTKTEPVYTVMEFMLYGDLKNFLLARRHLVNEKYEESDEISSKKLTSMALDVARGLSYLADLKYVHRDVASRNCLVNAQRMVKLADFGMTRLMTENDYYKFNRKGMLPVRWMSPESLALGVYTPSSDIWSYGVLLYEIITFGSFPFQGLSQTQVFEHVRAGNTLQIPQGVKPQLEGLLKSCWSRDPKLRPTAKEIVEFLGNNPRLLYPCLDAPLASVQLDDTGQLEMHLPDQFRKCSTTSSKSVAHSPALTNCVPKVSTVKSDAFESPSRAARQESIPDSGVSLQMDSNCLREPLLGPIRTSSSLLGLSKYVQHNRNDSGCEQEDDFCTHSPMNGHAITKV